MNKTEFRAKVLYPVYRVAKKMIGSPLHLPLTCQTVKEANQLIYDTLQKDKPVMICRMGATELRTVVAFLNQDLSPVKKFVHFIKTEQIGFSEKIRWMMCNYSGFFPADEEYLSKFCNLMLDCMGEADILGCWRPEEFRVRKYFKPDLQTISLTGLEPLFCDNPWTSCLKEKKVLVVHPFIESIVKQYAIREKLFKNKNILPGFELKTVKAVQSIGGVCNFPTWFDALKHMEDEISDCDFDIALIGAGAYGFPLAAHVKRMGKKAIHLGGVLQMLFGVYGNRWKDSPLINEYWIRPSIKETPESCDKVENKTYW